MPLREEFKSQGDLLFKYRSYWPILIIVLGLFVFIRNQSSGQQFFKGASETSYWIFCVAISLFGLLIRIITVGYSSDNTSGRNTTEGQIADDINSTGIYATVRHPLYVGNFFMWLGIACFTQKIWFIVAFILMYWLYYERIMYAEEEFMRGKYGDAYVNWALQTPAFIPALRKWKKPANTFSWIKIIRQEKAGILNLCIVVFVFVFIADYLQSGNFGFNNSFGILGFGLAYYIVIKGIEKGTGLLSKDR